MPVERIDTNLGSMDPLTAQLRDIQLQQLRQQTWVTGTEQSQQLQDRAAAFRESSYLGGVQKANGVNLSAQAPVGAQPTTAGPHSPYGHSEPRKLTLDGTYYKIGEGHYEHGGGHYVGLSTNQVKLTKDGTQAYSGASLAQVMNKKDPANVTPENPEGYSFPDQRNKLIKQNDVVEIPGEYEKGADGKFLLDKTGNKIPVLAVKVGAAPNAGDINELIPGLGRAAGGQAGGTVEVGQSALNFASRNSWLLYAMGGLGGTLAGGVGGGIIGLGGAFMSAGALRQAAGTANGLSLSANGISSPSLGNLGGWGGMVAGGLGSAFPGMAHNAKAMMNSYAREFKDDQLISMIDNAGIPIEDLIFLFMASMSDNYEEKLREKMRESMIAEKLEERRNRRERASDMEAGMAQGIGGFFGPLGSMAGGVVGQGIKMKAMKENEIESALNGNIKSSTTLANEVQMLMHKWKQLNEMMSSLIKALHEMAMTPIRNIR